MGQTHTETEEAFRLRKEAGDYLVHFSEVQKAVAAERARIRQMALDRADDYAVDPGDDGPEDRARRLRRDTLLDFAALLEDR